MELLEMFDCWLFFVTNSKTCFLFFGLITAFRCALYPATALLRFTPALYPAQRVDAPKGRELLESGSLLERKGDIAGSSEPLLLCVCAHVPNCVGETWEAAARSCCRQRCCSPCLFIALCRKLIIAAATHTGSDVSGVEVSALACDFCRTRGAVGRMHGAFWGIMHM